MTVFHGMALCGSCNDVLRFEGGNKEENTIHSTYRSFLAAVDEACCICHGLYSQLPEEWKQELHRQAAATEASSEHLFELDDDGYPKRAVTWYSRTSASSRTGSVRLEFEPAGGRTRTISVIE